MPLWTCDYEACSRPAVRLFGECILCNRHLCFQHLQTPIHECPKWEDESRYDSAAREAERLEVNHLISTINTSALAKSASNLRKGLQCSIPDLRYDQQTRSSAMGGMNYHIEIRFDDGIIWLARIRRFNATSPPPQLRDYIVKSEVATLQFLEQTAVPGPKVRGFALEFDETNEVGVGYILMEKLPGKSFDKSQASETQARSVAAQLADIYLELSKYPFPAMGSLDHPGAAHVGPFARESLTDFDGPKMTAIGPCSSIEEYHISSIQMVLNLILKEEMYAEQAVDAYLIHRFLLDLVPKITPKSTLDTKFFLKHPDEKGDHILVDDAGNITGIVDWEWAFTAPLELAFNSPIVLLPVANFYDGAQSISEDEVYFASCLQSKDGAQLAEAVRVGRLQHFFEFCCGYDLGDWKGFLGLFRGLRDAVGIDSGIDWDEWRARMLQRYNADQGLQHLLAAHKQQ